jgi:hypothetical protein
MTTTLTSSWPNAPRVPSIVGRAFPSHPARPPSFGAFGPARGGASLPTEKTSPNFALTAFSEGCLRNKGHLAHVSFLVNLLGCPLSVQER